MTAPILFSDPLDVLIVEAQIIREWRPAIRETVERIIERCGDGATVAARSFVGKIGENVPDAYAEIRRSIKNAAIEELARQGMRI